MSRRTPVEATTAPPIEVLIADDHHGFRRVLCALLDPEDDIRVVGEAVDGDEAVAKSLDLVPNVVLLDVEMPGTGGIDAARAIKEGGAHGQGGHAHHQR